MLSQIKYEIVCAYIYIIVFFVLYNICAILYNVYMCPYT